MLPALLLLIAEPQVINVQERVPLALVVSMPTGLVANVGKSELIRIASDLVRRHTDFFPQELDEIAVRDCKGRLTCLALKSRRDYGSQQPGYLLLISNVPVPDGADRMSLTLLDVERAILIHRDAPRRPGWQDEVEATVSEDAAVSPPLGSGARDVQEALTLLATVFTRNLADELEKAGHWEPFGEIEIACEVEGAVIKLDGNGVGSTIAGVTRLAGARPGIRSVELEHPKYLPFRTTLEVTRGGIARAEATFEAPPGNDTGIVRQVVLWSGVAAAAAGVGIAIAGAALPSDGETSCFAPCETGREFRTFGDGPVAVAPLGFALAGTGLVWALGTWLFGGSDDVPWIQLVTGAVVGGTTYALSVLLDHRTPEAE